MAKKITSVKVGWKHITDVKPKQPGTTSFNVCFPKIVFSGDELKGRTQWTDAQWLKYAVNEYQKQKGFKPHTKDEFVERSFKPVKASTKINPNKKRKSTGIFIAIWTTSDDLLWAEACPTENDAFASAATMVAQLTGFSFKKALVIFTDAMNTWDFWEVDGGPDRVTVMESKKFKLQKK